MNRDQLTRAIAKAFFLSLSEATAIIGSILDQIASSLKKGERVYLKDFCSLTKVIRPGRNVRHPRTGEIIVIPGGPAVRFSASPALLRAIAGAKPRRTAAIKAFS